MAFDGLVTKSIVKELNNKLIGAKVNKIYEPNKNEIILDLYNKEKYTLNICIEASNCRIHLTKHTKPNPKVAPNFCMVLRKYLTSAKILSIDTYGLDRIVIINFQNYDELNYLVSYKLIVELMGKHSNIILLNNNNIIIDSMRHISSREATRNTLPANPYVFPEANKLDLLNISEGEFIKYIENSSNNSNSNNNLINIVSNSFIGISKSFINYTLDNYLKIDIDNYSEKDLISLYNYINLILNEPVTLKEFETNDKKDFCIIPSNNSSDISLNYAIDEFYYNKETLNTFITYRNTILKLILTMLSKHNKKLINIQEKLNECENMDEYKVYGELITSNLYRINNNINIDSISLENYYDNNNLITIPLDKKFSPSLNAKNFFKKYNKLKNTLSIVSKQKEIIKTEISYLETIVYELNECTNINELDEVYQEIQENILKPTDITKNKKDKNSNTISPISIDGYSVYIGKNNTQNDIITFKLSDKNDIWFHVQGFHGSHVLLKTNGKEINDNNSIILKCAKLAVLHSKASNENKAPVDYTLIKNIKKPKGSKPGFVVFNNYKTIIVKNNAK